MKKIIIIAAVLIVLILGAGFYITHKGTSSVVHTQTETADQTTAADTNTVGSANNQTNVVPREEMTITDDVSTSTPAASTNSGAVVNTYKAPSLKEFTVTGKNFSFTPSVLTAKVGDRVSITFKNQNGNHDLVIDQFNAATQVIPGGQEETIEFTADKAGSFEYYCSVGNHRAMGMKGILKVE